MIRRTFQVAATSWAVALPLATFAASRPQGSLVYLLTAAVYLIGAAICHQRPERSFYFWGALMPVCARCAGVYFGAALAAIVNILRVTPRRGSAIAILSLAAFPTAATLIYEWTTGDMPTNFVRAAAGICLGAGVAALIHREVN